MTSRHVPAAVALIVATPVAVWSLLGDLSETQFDDLDYLWRPPAIPRAVELVVGMAALGVVLASAYVLAAALKRGEVRREWSATLVPLCVAGALGGSGGRVVTAGGIGADIGGALVLMFGVPLGLGLLISATANAWAVRRR